MKKSILAITALALMLASCSQDETIEVTTREAITFGNAFIENSTRAVDNSYNNEGFIAPFHVYGTITNKYAETANLFNQELVENKNGSWVYNEAHTQYWIPGNTYNFTAIVDGNVRGVTSVTTDKTTGMPEVITLYDASQQRDILYAKSEERNYNLGDPAKEVKFTFHHLLSKAKVTVMNEMAVNSGYSYKVENVYIEKSPQKAIYVVAQQEWTDRVAGNYKPNFGHVVSESDINGAEASMIGFGEKFTANWERLLVPVIDKLYITFTRKLYRSGVLIETEQVTVESEEVVDLQPGRAYNFLIKLGNPGEPIKFSVNKVNGWGNDNEVKTQETNK